ncbi:MAG: YqhA family protein, partial [Bacteroidota bacterium]
WLVIKDFDELKLLLVKASIMVIAISFVGKAVTWKGDTNIMYYGIGIGAVIAALSFFMSIKILKDGDHDKN